MENNLDNNPSNDSKDISEDYKEENKKNMRRIIMYALFIIIGIALADILVHVIHVGMTKKENNKVQTIDVKTNNYRLVE